MILKFWHFVVVVVNDSLEVSKNLIFSNIGGLISCFEFMQATSCCDKSSQILNLECLVSESLKTFLALF